MCRECLLEVLLCGCVTKRLKNPFSKAVHCCCQRYHHAPARSPDIGPMELRATRLWYVCDLGDPTLPYLPGQYYLALLRSHSVYGSRNVFARNLRLPLISSFPHQSSRHPHRGGPSELMIKARAYRSSGRKLSYVPLRAYLSMLRRNALLPDTPM